MSGIVMQLVPERVDLLCAERALRLRELEREHGERRDLRGEGLGGGDADLGTGVRVDDAVGLSRVTRLPTTLVIAMTFAPRSRASRTPASVSAVSPDCVIATTSVSSSTIGSL